MFPLNMLHLCPDAAERPLARPGRQARRCAASPTLRACAAAKLLRACFVLALLLPFLHAFALPACAEPIRVSASADAGADPVLGRQQAQERAFLEAVCQTAQRLVPAPLPESRAALLRRHLAPRAANLVQSFQEVAAPRPAVAAAPVPAQAGPLTLDVDVEVHRAALNGLLLRLGLLAGPARPRVFALRLGNGVAEKDVQALGDLLALQDLTRAAQAPVQVSLERLPQGYLKAVLRQDSKAFVADGQDLGLVWQDVWGQYFSSAEQLPGAGTVFFAVSGFAVSEGALEFTRVLAAWDDCLREVQLHALDVWPGNSAARWSARVTNPDRLNARFQDYLPSRKLTVAR
ncbi:MAG: hypothetical protein KKA55_04350 [Proteobacteria bacterium]|nr:hypothetical protein [Pseudomonadota bacterium]MBU1594746.1 hypothetical protein [Pseudomonadota bacterium]